MELMIHCPHCKMRLVLPEHAAGHIARCKQCHTQFRVPADNEMVEDTIACWLEIDNEQDKARREAEERNSSSYLGDTLEEAPPELGSITADDLTETVARSYPGAKVPEPAAPAQGRASTHTATQAPPHHAAPATHRPTTHAAPSHAPAHHAPAPAHPARPAVPAGAAQHTPPTQAPQHQPAPPQRSQAYPPTEEGQIRLNVLETHAGGVLMAFDSQLLKRPGFRASMPFCCLGCGEKDITKLSARPLAFGDRAPRQTGEELKIESDFTVHIHACPTPRDVLASMRPIEILPDPFCLPMPYYVCTGCAAKVSVHCHTAAAGATVMCESFIPSIPYALEWLGRVNGICGDDYADLESHITTSANDAWNLLPENVRLRVSGWFKYDSYEQFLAYISDSDFPKSDSGQAGIVLTDQRLVYCKYHHHGELKTHEPGTTIFVLPSGRICDLTAEWQGQKIRLVRLKPTDVELLAGLLENIKSPIQIVRLKPNPLI